MLYPYIRLSDETEILHSHLIEENGEQIVEVHFERPTNDGFDIARCQLPSYRWLKREGFSQEEIQTFQQFLENNAHLLFKYAKEGGIKFA